MSSQRRLSRDEHRSAALLVGTPPAGVDWVGVPEVAEAVVSRRVPSSFARRYQERLAREGRLTVLDDLAAVDVARRAALGDEAPGPPEVLVRVEAVPAAADPGAVARFRAVREVLAAHAVRLLAPVPVDADPGLVAELREGGASFGVAPDLRGVKGEEATGKALDAADRALAGLGEPTDVLVPAGGVLARLQWPVAARRYETIASGPASVRTLGWHPGPLWRGNAVHLPSHAPLTGSASEAAALVGTLREREMAVWVCVVVDWRAEDEAAVVALAESVTGVAVDWERWRRVVRTSRAAA